MASAFDEPSTEYGLVAEAVQHPADFAFVTYRLRQAARFHDGTPMTPEDVIWSMESLRAVPIPSMPPITRTSARPSRAATARCASSSP